MDSEHGDSEHGNSMIAEFLKRPSRSTLTQFAKADLVGLAIHLGCKNTFKKAELTGIVDELAVSQELLETIHPPVAPVT